MPNAIQLLPKHVANQIAAGEVVQRPSSIVKELLENAIDAAATNIQLVVKESGKTLVQVIDNGIGMSPVDAELCFERHATSKISSAQDLFSLTTKGFRGEALASIAAIAHVELKTRRDQDELGTLLKIEGNKISSKDLISVSKGTSIAVKNLFYNIPARRSFLKSNNVELRHVIEEFYRTALIHTEVHFLMYHNGKELFNLPASNFRQRIVNIFGNKTNTRLVPVSEHTEIISVDGFVGKPEYARKSRGEQFFFVNKRFIKSPYLHHAVCAAFDGLLPPKAFPSYYLNLTVNPNTIDINIHPTKTEIKFEDEHTIYAVLRAAIKHSLGQFSITPTLDFDRDKNLDTPYQYNSKSVRMPSIDTDPNFNPFASTTSTTKNISKKISASDWEGLYVGLDSKGNDNKNKYSSLRLESDPISEVLFDEEQVSNKYKTFQIQNKYIVNTIKSGMVIIHQNRAHQRILYEDFLKKITLKKGGSQKLLFTVDLDFNKAEINTLKSIQDQLEHSGFVFDNFAKEKLTVSALPVGVEGDNVQAIFRQIIYDIDSDLPDTHFSTSDLLAKSFANSLSINSGKTLNSKEQEFLVNSLFACKEPMLSPFNKKVYITMDLDEIDNKFN